ncbi:DUF4339 domain-containing protein [Candidatus Laterigemmans baculatus]|uniref:DUF4339 domain-containing protein n=1 Tax=Candidatus Laterigemmans baculatus TaxID=2770505 RepID=UPI0013DB3A76|nr:DUF4339 domain-containing protein [Candidatus Laterigemmans baculatus]
MTDSSDQYFVRFRGRTLGPLPAQRVQELVRRGQITRLHELSPDGLSWSKAETFDSLFRRPAPQSASSSTTQAVEPQTSTGGAEPATPQPLTAKAGSAADPEVQWYAHIGEESRGPVSTQKLMEWIDGGVVDRTTLVWRAGFDSWQPAEQSLPQRFSPIQPGHAASPFSRRPTLSLGAYDTTTTGNPNDWSLLATEMHRRRGWALFFGIFLISLASLQVLAQIVVLLMAASNSESRAETFGAAIWAMTGLAIAGPILYSGILVIRYCNWVSEFRDDQNQANALKALKRLSSLWMFSGITALVWLVLLIAAPIIVITLGLEAIEAFS